MTLVACDNRHCSLFIVPISYPVMPHRDDDTSHDSLSGIHGYRYHKQSKFVSAANSVLHHFGLSVIKEGRCRGRYSLVWGQPGSKEVTTIVRVSQTELPGSWLGRSIDP